MFVGEVVAVVVVVIVALDEPATRFIVHGMHMRTGLRRIVDV